jgi:protease secretion system membrane fusion protein
MMQFKNLTKYNSHESQGWMVILIGFFGFILWASLYELDQGVSANGFVIPKSEKLLITSPSSGLISALYKKSGDQVIAGESVLQIDPLATESMLNRLNESSQSIQNTIQTLELALRSRNQQISILQAQYAQTKKIIDGGFVNQQNALNAKNEHIKFLENQLKSNQKLFDAGFLSKNGLEKISAELAWAQADAYDLGAKHEQVVSGALQNLSGINTQIALAQSESLQLKASIDENKSKFNEIKEQILAVQHELNLLNVTSPVNGSLMSLTIKSQGVNVLSGQPLFEIVPDSDRLAVDIKIPVEYADRVTKGMGVEILFPSLSGSTTMQVKGVLDYVSGDKVTDSATNQLYLEAHVDLIEPSDIKTLNLRVGIPAYVLINTGPRTLISYMLRPLNDRVSMGMK